MHRRWIPAALLALLLASPSQAVEGSWATGAGVNQVVYTLDLTCPNPGFVCDLIDGYTDTQTSTVTGAGTLEIDDGLDEFQFLMDSTQDVGSGPQDAYATVTGTDLTFANIPFAGVPEITNLLVFALSNPLIAIPGVDLTVAADHPFSQTVNYSGTGLVIGDLEFLLGPNLVVPPADIVVSGIFRALGDVGGNGSLDYELVDVMATFTLQNVTTIGGEPVTVDVTADMTLNLTGNIGPPPVPQVPALPAWGVALLAAALLAGARRR